MKHLFLGAFAAIGLVACDGAPAGAAGDGYDLDILASEADGVLHVVRDHEHDRIAAILTREDDPDAARLLEGRAAERAYDRAVDSAEAVLGDAEEPQIKVFGLSLYAEDESGDGDGRVRFEVETPGGRTVMIDAGDRDPDGGVAHIAIHGVGAQGAEEFIDDIDDAPRDLREKMKDALEL